MGAFEFAGLRLYGSSKGPFLVAEKLGFKQGFSQCAAINRHKGSFFSRPKGMDGSGDQFFPDTRFASDEHSGAGWAKPFDETEDLQHFGASADHTAKAILTNGLIGWKGLKSGQRPLRGSHQHSND